MELGRTQILTDIIHGTIIYSGIEKEIIGSPIFNRLHRVLQSSLVYLTYSSNKVKRFEHSIGAMYLAGEIFYSSISNTSTAENTESASVFNDFFKEIKDEIIKWRKDENLQFINSETANEYKARDNSILKAPIPESSFYNMYMPGNVDSVDKLPYLVVFQSIRLAALLHDVGHMPYSHVMESILKELVEYVLNIDEENRNKNQTDFIEIMSEYSDDAIHEKIGMILIKKIEESILSNLPKKRNDNYLFLMMVLYFARKILASKPGDNTIFSDLHLIISSVLDADRLDFCSRDLLCSGLQISPINYGKIIPRYTLIRMPWAVTPLVEKNNKDIKRDKRFYFAPSTISIDNIEDVINRRWMDYSLINYHHRVQKHEALMQDVLVELAKEELNSDDELPKIDYILPPNVSSIWQILKLINSNEPIEYLFIQLDDSWLDTILKNNFFSRYKNEYSALSKNAKDIFWNKFDELISAKRHYLSYFKRNDEFKNFDEDLYNIIRDELNTNKDLENIDFLYSTTIKQCEYIEFIKERGTFFFNSILITVSELADNFDLLNCIERYLKNEIDIINVSDVFIRSNQFNLGYSTTTTPLYLVESNNKIIQIEEISSQHNDLKAKQCNSAAFHLYYLPSFDDEHGELNKVNLNDINDKLLKAGKLAIVDLIKKLNEGLTMSQ